MTIDQCLKNTLINNIIISTDNNLIYKKFLGNKKVISILRPKNLSYKYIDILTVANFTLKKLEKKMFILIILLSRHQTFLLGRKIHLKI
jgi:hypothetical protein